MLSSDILFNGDASSRREALELFQDALAHEWRVQVRLDAELGYDETTEEFREDAEKVRILLRGCGDIDDNLAQRWSTSADPMIAFVGEVLTEGNFSRFAI